MVQDLRNPGDTGYIVIDAGSTLVPGSSLLPLFDFNNVYNLVLLVTIAARAQLIAIGRSVRLDSYVLG